jgi:glycosyltransferase involved in cell wall biosynthesis
MKIAFDSTIFSQQVYGGVSRYFCSLAEHLAKLGGVEPKIIAPLHVNRYLRTLDPHLVSGLPMRPLRGTTGALRELNALLFWPAAWQMRPQLVHETYYAPRPSYLARVPRVLTVYDMIHERHPENYPPLDRIATFKKAAILRADHIFCISENTRRDLQEIYRLPDNRISVTHLGHALPTGDAAAGLAANGGAPFLLYVGERRGYKNFSGLLAAYASSAWLRENFCIVCFGGGAFSQVERELMSSLGIAAQQLRQQSGSDSDLANLYCAAAALVYPSRYEGFGIPPLEAMSLDCPVVCSRASSIPEVVGDAGEYFDPDDPASIRAAIENLLQSTGRQAMLRAAGRARGRDFSWDRCARETLLGYEKLLPSS